MDAREAVSRREILMSCILSIAVLDCLVERCVYLIGMTDVDLKFLDGGFSSD